MPEKQLLKQAIIFGFSVSIGVFTVFFGILYGIKRLIQWIHKLQHPWET